ncbi:lipoate--protein ligase family protein [Halorubrum sp. Atlit-26R]|uniref:lipoyl protein ligase domain-containing protein n=1 Tax=Halorubrum sp. Atlit-26R TaxID=2282128 RepID=UPI000EF18472|nr:lipoate--protein ligase family protein [Halorubrum sp. Atlit-26R]RLM64078.1 lipoate--protein ligase family protein [Halorubrum sp. Atlit-26R]
MRVYRGEFETPAADREPTADLLASAADGVPAVRVTAPPRQVAFGRRDGRESGFEAAKRAAEAAGFPPLERDVGGRAVAYTGSTLSFGVAVPTGDGRGSIDSRYETATETLRDALRDLGADVVRGEPRAAFCPGDHSLRVAGGERTADGAATEGAERVGGGGKVAGLAQRVRADAALVAGVLVVSAADPEPIARVTAPVYDALDVPFDPESVGSVADAGGPDDPEAVARAVEAAFVEGPWGDGERETVRVDGADA